MAKVLLHKRSDVALLYIIHLQPRQPTARAAQYRQVQPQRVRIDMNTTCVHKGIDISYFLTSKHGIDRFDSIE